MAASTMVAVYFLYSALLAMMFAVGSPYWLVQMLRLGKYRAGLRERLGAVPARIKAASGGTVWVHAVSVGEVLAVSRLVEEFRARFGRVVISTTTHTGQKLARERFGEANVFYFPLDFGFLVRRYMRALRPEVVVLAETEFWPNFLRAAKESEARVAVVNARISDRSLPRYMRVRGMLGRVLRNVDLFMAQTDEDARRLVAIGADKARVQVSGNLKFEVKPPEQLPIVKQLKDAIGASGAGPVLVAGSTVDGEEEMLLDAFHAAVERIPTALMILAPRHKERFAAVAHLLAESGLAWTKRSQWQATSHELAGSVLLLDSIGELAATFAVADVAFIGGSLVPRGGHNILEPAQAGVATLVGPHTENFRDIVQIFLKAGAVQVVTPGTLTNSLLALLENIGERDELGRRAKQVLKSQQGATERTMAAIAGLKAAAR
jgi:3-deoxy-D-manno-octulosonic-acid transferase